MTQLPGQVVTLAGKGWKQYRCLRQTLEEEKALRLKVMDEDHGNLSLCQKSCCGLQPTSLNSTKNLPVITLQMTPFFHRQLTAISFLSQKAANLALLPQRLEGTTGIFSNQPLYSFYFLCRSRKVVKKGNQGSRRNGGETGGQQMRGMAAG